MTTLAAMTAVTTAAPSRPRAFVPPGNKAVRLAHLDPRPLWDEPAPAKSPLTSPTFWLAGAIVLPVAGVARLLRAFS